LLLLLLLLMLMLMMAEDDENEKKGKMKSVAYFEQRQPSARRPGIIIVDPLLVRRWMVDVLMSLPSSEEILAFPSDAFYVESYTISSQSCND
jgi:hypothetical protein